MVNYNWIMTLSFNRNPIFVVRFKLDGFGRSKLESVFELRMVFEMANCLSLQQAKKKEKEAEN